jgi:hypothetical protein
MFEVLIGVGMYIQRLLGVSFLLAGIIAVKQT